MTSRVALTSIVRLALGVALLAATASGLTACSPASSPASSSPSDPGPASSVDQPTILVFAAASLTDAFTDLARAFEDTAPGVTVDLSVGGSSALREQILDGAPADVFASASETVMAEVVDAGAVTGMPRTLAHNSLELAVPRGNPGNVHALSDLSDPDLLVGLCAEGVPCGDLARQVLDRAGVDASVDTEEPDVRTLVNRVALGELDVGIVYATDLQGRDDLEGVAIPPSENVAATYLIAPLAGGEHHQSAQEFVDFATSSAGRRILAEHGFDVE